MKILHILPIDFGTDSYPEQMSTRGGAERYAFYLSKELSKTFETKLMVFGKKRKTLIWGNLTIEVFPAIHYFKKFNFNSNSIPLSVPSLFNEIKKHDVIHCHQYYTDTTFLAIILSRLLNKKVFVTDHGWKGLNLARFLHPNTLVTRFLIQTAFQKNFFSSNKSNIIYGGVDLENYTYVRKKHNKILFLGRILPHKGIEYLINAIDFKTRLVIAGRKGNDEYLTYLKSISINKNVHFLIDAPDTTTLEELKTSKILVLPSTHLDKYGKYHPLPELFGLAVIEAMACGTPAIVTRVGSLPDIVEDGVTGFIVPPNDSDTLRNRITQLINNQQLIEKMGKVARRKVLNNFTWSKVADNCLVAYTSQLGVA